jgi:hypothetical protein
MKASLLARAVPALLLTAILAAEFDTTGFAQSTAPAAPAAGSTSVGSTAAPPSTPTTTSSAATATHHAATAHTQRASSRVPGETMVQMAEQRINDLHTRLHITAQQQSQWDQFAQAMRDNAKDLDQAYQQRATGFDSMNAVQNMQSYAQIEQTRSQDLQKLVPAFQTLYASLSDQQKQQADALFRNQTEHAQQRRAASAH